MNDATGVDLITVIKGDINVLSISDTKQTTASITPIITPDVNPRMILAKLFTTAL